MPGIRPFTDADVPPIAALHQRVFGVSKHLPRPELETAFRDVFLHNPWRDLDLPSFVYEDGRGRPVGFLGILPRAMRFRDEPCVVAVSSQFMIDPDVRAPRGAMQLLRAAFDGPQDLLITDGATEPLGVLWRGRGGVTSHLYNMQWCRPLRPAELAVDFARPYLGAAGTALRVGLPLYRLGDAAFTRLKPNRFLRAPADLVVDPLDDTTWLEGISGFTGRVSLRPEYDAATLAWLGSEANKRRKLGALHRVALRKDDGTLAGWYLCYVRRHDVCEVLQLAAVPGQERAVFRRLLADAAHHGATGVVGRADPHLMEVLGENHCLFVRTPPVTLMHSKRPELLDALHRGDAFFSRLEAEWWMRFVGG